MQKARVGATRRNRERERERERDMEKRKTRQKGREKNEEVLHRADCTVSPGIAA